MTKRKKAKQATRVTVYADTNHNGRLEKQGDGWLIDRNGFAHADAAMKAFAADGTYCESRET